MLKAEEKAEVGAFVRVEFENIFAVESGGAGGDFVGGMAHEDFAKGAFAGAVFAHNGVDFAGFDGESEAFEDFFVVDAGVEVGDL